LVELALEENKVTASLGLLVDHIDLKLLEGVDYFKEVTMVKEKAEITLFSLFDDLLDWDNKGVLVEVVLKFGGLVLLDPKI
jgi:hypothetical protein